MKQKLLKAMLLLCALIVGSGTMWADDYELYSGTITEGDYVIVYDGGALKNTISSNRLDYSDVTISNNKISNPEASVVWHIAASGGYWTIYNSSVSKYAGGTTTKNQGALLSSVTDYAKWTVTGTNSYDFENYGRAKESNKWLRKNGTYGFACYASGTGGALSLYKKTAASATALAVKTAPTKLNYKKGETLDLTGLVLDATVGVNHVDVTSGYTASPANGATLNSVGAQTVTFTYGGQTTTQTIHVGDLESIALTTTGVKTTYDEGQTFDPENLVVTATYSDGEDTPTTWTEDVTASCSYDPDGALETSDENVEVSYTLGSTTKTANIAITVNAASAYTVTFNAGTGSCATASLTEASAKAGVTLPTATIGVTGWSFAGWATASVTSTDVEPTLYAAGDTYKPIDDCTLYAVYSFSELSSTTYKRATAVSDITSSDKIVIAYNDGKVLNTSINMSTTLEETSGKVTPASNAIFTLSGNNTDGYTLTNGTNTIGTTGSGNSLTIALSSTNNLWTFSASTYGSNHFNVNNKGASGKSLEVYSSAWKAYALTASGPAWAMRIYVPAEVTTYNSTPAAIVNPTIAWTTAGDKTLYLQNTNTYDNAADVTGIAKTPVYTSSDATVASVSEAGVVTALKTGTTTIKATVEAEAGVNTKAEVSYVVTVKDASNIAGIKAITSSSSAVTFTADLTDAVVTYVNDSHAYIQDASGAIYASCGNSLTENEVTAGKMINGSVSGSVKAANQIDEITAIDLSDATVTDGVIPSASVISAATLAAKKADYEGKLVSIEGATVTANLTSGSASGGKISDDSKVTEINLYAPDSNIEALKDAEGTFNGYISLYGGSTVRFNIYEQSQITLTKNAPTDQPLAFQSDAVELDEETSAYSAFTGQTVNGAQGTVTYSIDSDDDDVVTSINASTGAVELSGNYGTATIKASAAANEVTVEGITTPYTATEKTYTITVYPRYTVTFSVNGVETNLRQTSHDAEIEVPSPEDIYGFKFMGWSAVEVVLTDVAPSMESLGATITPKNNTTSYFAVYAVEVAGDDENVELYKNEGSTGTDATSGITASGNVNTTSSNGNPGNSFGLTSQANKTVTFTGIDISTAKSASLKLDYKLAKSGTNYSSLTVTQYDSEDKVLGSATEITGSDQTYHTSGNIALNTACVKITIVCSPASSTYNTFVDNVIITVTRSGASYENYCTTISEDPINVTLNASGYATFASTYPLDFTDSEDDGYSAWQITGVIGEAITFSQITETVAAGTGVLLKGTASEAIRIPVAASGTDISETNKLVGITSATAVSADQYFGLSGNQFKKVNAGTVPAGKALLPASAVSGSSAKSFTFIFDTATGVRTVEKVSAAEAEAIFNLAGQRIQKPQRGINIVNGRKVVVK